MTDPIRPMLPAAPVPNAPAPQTDPVRVDVSRAAAAPIYVYRVTDTVTGRTLVEIPTGKTQEAGAPGAQLDATV